ncbi:MAG: hypothetical protein ABJQ37_03000 [Reichenbachiella sp.]|uniref:hypothetical protein n=2 Tax=Reichenbachiella sp. TaxID=2184521 RepID=UPI00329931BE
MKLEGKNILLISPEHWSDMKVSKHHYAEHLAQKNQVWFLNPPSQNFLVTRKSDQLNIIDYRPKFKGLQYLPNWLSAILIRTELTHIQSQIGYSFDIIWNFDPSRFFNLSKIDAFRICHIVDWNQKYQRQTLAKTADICFSTSSYLQEELGKFNRHSYFINHGYAERKIVEIDLPDQKDKRLKAGYVGNLNIKYLDWLLIHEVVTQHSEVLFYFIGPYNLESGDPQMKEVLLLENSRFLGKVDAGLVPSYLVKMDLLFLAYKADEFPKQLANPHKMLEYLGSGKTIVCTFTNEYKTFPNLITMSEKNNNFSQIFTRCMVEFSNLNHKNNSSERLNLAYNNTYDQQLKNIENYLNAEIS